ncbi:MAG: hypothetical protein HC828_06185 [Blastochloris sp.]|nr:hypothetical protein [Blastochloris sp.]
MHIFVIFVIAATIIFARIASRPRNDTSTRGPVSTAPSRTTWHHRGSIQLLGRSLAGMGIALVIIALCSFPWPSTAGVWSGSVAVEVAHMQFLIWQHRDVLVVMSTLFWMLLPVWGMVIRLGLREGRALVRIGYLIPIWGYQQGRSVLARAAVCYHLRCGVIRPLWGRVTRWVHHGWWFIRFGAWATRRTLVWCYRGTR